MPVNKQELRICLQLDVSSACQQTATTLSCERYHIEAVAVQSRKAYNLVAAVVNRLRNANMLAVPGHLQNR